MEGELTNAILFNPRPSLGSVDYALSQGLKHDKGFISNSEMNIT